MELALTIRQATPDDADVLAALHLRSAHVGFSDIFPVSHLTVSHDAMSADWLARLQADPQMRRATLVKQAAASWE